MDDIATSDEISDKLKQKGYENPLQVAVSNPLELTNVLGISETEAENIINSARESAEIGGFKSGTEVSDPPDLSEVDAVPDVEGWNIHFHTMDRISWVTPSDYSVVVTTQPTKGDSNERTFTVHGILPPEGEHNPQQSKKEERPLKEQIESADEAVGYAIGYMESNPIDFKEDLTEFSGISERTAEYLLLKYDAWSHQDLYELWKGKELKQVVANNYHEELDEEMKEVFGGKPR